MPVYSHCPVKDIRTVLDNPIPTIQHIISQEKALRVFLRELIPLGTVRHQLGQIQNMSRTALCALSPNQAMVNGFLKSSIPYTLEQDLDKQDEAGFDCDAMEQAFSSIDYECLIEEVVAAVAEVYVHQLGTSIRARERNVLKQADYGFRMLFEDGARVDPKLIFDFYHVYLSYAIAKESMIKEMYDLGRFKCNQVLEPLFTFMCHTFAWHYGMYPSVYDGESAEFIDALNQYIETINSKDEQCQFYWEWLSLFLRKGLLQRGEVHFKLSQINFNLILDPGSFFIALAQSQSLNYQWDEREFYPELQKWINNQFLLEVPSEQGHLAKYHLTYRQMVTALETWRIENSRTLRYASEDTARLDYLPVNMKLLGPELFNYITSLFGAFNFSYGDAKKSFLEWCHENMVLERLGDQDTEDDLTRFYQFCSDKKCIPPFDQTVLTKLSEENNTRIAERMGILYHKLSQRNWKESQNLNFLNYCHWLFKENKGVIKYMSAHSQSWDNIWPWILVSIIVVNKNGSVCTKPKLITKRVNAVLGEWLNDSDEIIKLIKMCVNSKELLSNDRAPHYFKYLLKSLIDIDNVQRVFQSLSLYLNASSGIEINIRSIRTQLAKLMERYPHQFVQAIGKHTQLIRFLNIKDSVNCILFGSLFSDSDDPQTDDYWLSVDIVFQCADFRENLIENNVFQRKMVELKEGHPRTFQRIIELLFEMGVESKYYRNKVMITPFYSVFNSFSIEQKQRFLNTIIKMNSEYMKCMELYFGAFERDLRQCYSTMPLHWQQDFLGSTLGRILSFRGFNDSQVIGYSIVPEGKMPDDRNRTSYCSADDKLTLSFFVRCKPSFPISLLHERVKQIQVFYMISNSIQNLNHPQKHAKQLTSLFLRSTSVKHQKTSVPLRGDDIQIKEAIELVFSLPIELSVCVLNFLLPNPSYFKFIQERFPDSLYSNQLMVNMIRQRPNHHLVPYLFGGLKVLTAMSDREDDNKSSDSPCLRLGFKIQ